MKIDKSRKMWLDKYREMWLEHGEGLSCVDLNMTEIKILRLLESGPEIVKFISDEIDISKPGTLLSIEKLINKGYIDYRVQLQDSPSLTGPKRVRCFSLRTFKN